MLFDEDLNNPDANLKKSYRFPSGALSRSEPSTKRRYISRSKSPTKPKEIGYNLTEKRAKQELGSYR